MDVHDDTIRVLHVDDQPDFTDLVATYLEREADDLTVETATGPEEGVAILEGGHVDCVVSDFDMPGTNGLEFLETVRAHRPDLPFILYTGKGSEEVASRAISSGVTDYLQKAGGADHFVLLANRIRNAVGSYRSREALEARNVELSRYEQLINSMLEAACIYDESGHFETVNQYLAEWYGTTPEALEGEPSNLIPLVREQYEGDPYQELLDGTRDRLQGTVEGAFPGRGRAVLEFRLTPLRTERCGPGVVGVTRDVTDETARDAALRVSRAEYRDLFDGMNDTAWVLGLDGGILAVNQTAVDTLGYSEAELLSMSPHEFDAGLDDDEISSLIEDMPEDEFQMFETVHRTASGAEIPVEISSSLITYRGTDAILSVARDITLRKRRQRDFETVLDHMNDAILIHPPDGSFAFVNQAAVDRYGYTREEFADLGPGDLDLPEDATNPGGPGDASHLEISGAGTSSPDGDQTLEDAGNRVFETVHANTEGDAIPVEINASVIPFRGESMILSSARDVTERKRLQREREQIIDRVTDAIVDVDSSWRFTLVNEQAEAVYGMSADELLGRDFWEVFDSARGTRFEEEYRHVMDRREPRSIVEYFAQLDGYFDVTAYPKADGGVAFYFIDVTEQQEYQRELEETNQLLSTLFETLPVGVTVLGGDGTIDRANRRAEEVLGLAKSQITQRTYDDPDWAIFDADGDPVPEDELPFARVLETGDSVFNHEHGIRWADGTERWLSINASPISTDADGVEYVVAAISDRTETREYERAIEAQNARLEEFSSIVSHDLRNPLTVAMGHLEMASEDCESEHLVPVEEAHDRMAALISDLLSLARAGETEASQTTLSLQDLSEACWRTVGTQDATLTVERDGTIRGVEPRLRQLLENLFRNSIDHGGSGVSVSVGPLEDGFYVADDGPGIDEELRESVFEEGYSTRDDGTGLGLHIVEEIATSHGWTVEITDGATDGTRFEFRTTNR